MSTDSEVVAQGNGDSLSRRKFLGDAAKIATGGAIGVATARFLDGKGRPLSPSLKPEQSITPEQERVQSLRDLGRFMEIFTTDTLVAHFIAHANDHDITRSFTQDYVPMTDLFEFFSTDLSANCWALRLPSGNGDYLDQRTHLPAVAYVTPKLNDPFLAPFGSQQIFVYLDKEGNIRTGLQRKSIGDQARPRENLSFSREEMMHAYRKFTSPIFDPSRLGGSSHEGSLECESSYLPSQDPAKPATYVHGLINPSGLCVIRTAPASY